MFAAENLVQRDGLDSKLKWFMSLISYSRGNDVFFVEYPGQPEESEEIIGTIDEKLYPYDYPTVVDNSNTDK